MRTATGHRPVKESENACVRDRQTERETGLTLSLKLTAPALGLTAALTTLNINS